MHNHTQFVHGFIPGVFVVHWTKTTTTEKWNCNLFGFCSLTCNMKQSWFSLEMCRALFSSKSKKPLTTLQNCHTSATYYVWETQCQSWISWFSKTGVHFSTKGFAWWYHRLHLENDINEKVWLSLSSLAFILFRYRQMYKMFFGRILIYSWRILIFYWLLKGFCNNKKKALKEAKMKSWKQKLTNILWSMVQYSREMFFGQSMQILLSAFNMTPTNKIVNL